MKSMSLLFSLSSLILCSCATLSNHLDADRAKSIHKVAIVSFEIEQQKATDNLGIAGLKSFSEGEDKDSKELQSMAFKIVNNFSKEIEKKTHWQIIPMKEVISNNKYKKRVQETMSGVHSAMLSSTGGQVFAIKPNGVLDAMAFRNMSTEDRTTLAHELGVDAIAEIVVVNSMEQAWMSLGHISGDGAFSLKSRANLQVYSPEVKDPIWRSQNVEGEMTEMSDSLSEKLSKREKISLLGEKATNSAISKLVESYSL